MITSRRRFMQVAAPAAAFTILPRHVLGGHGIVAPSDKVNIAIVGVGGQGRTNARELMRHADAQIIALADPAEHWNLDAFYFRGVAGRAPVRAEIEKHFAEKTPNFHCAAYEDFRVMLEKEKAIDAILCSTPDHLHAYVSLLAMRKGKHVYCEKPLTHNIAEARLVARVAKETGVATQMGNQGHSKDTIRETCEWIWDGAIGQVREVHAWVPTSRWTASLTGKPKDAKPVPAGLNWDLWLGPAEPRPYHPAYAPVSWRDFWAFGCGALGDFGCHDLDAACWAFDLRAPQSVEVRPAGGGDAEIVPHGEIGYYHFARGGDKPALKIVWYSGGLLPDAPEELPQGTGLPRRGVLFIGDKGKMLCEASGGRPRLLPFEKTDEYKKPAATLPRSKGHHRDWLDAIKGGQPAGSQFEYAARLTEIVLLGVAALRTGRKLYWDPATMTDPGQPEAQPLFKGRYRAGWELP
jgi:predicted dehydrogenase